MSGHSFEGKDLAIDSEQSLRTDRLRDAVRRAGGRRVVADRSGIPFGTLGNYLAGRDMRAGALVAIADACEVSIEWLASGRGPRVCAEQPPASPPPTPEQVATAADHAMQEMLPAEMTQEDRDDLLQVTVLAERYLDRTMPGYLPDQLIITATNFFAAMRKYPGSRAEQYRRLMASLENPPKDAPTE